MRASRRDALELPVDVGPLYAKVFLCIGEKRLLNRQGENQRGLVLAFGLLDVGSAGQLPKIGHGQRFEDFASVGVGCPYTFIIGNGA